MNTPTITRNGYTWALNTAGEPLQSTRVAQLVRTYWAWEDGRRGAGAELHQAMDAATEAELAEASAWLTTDLDSLLTEIHQNLAALGAPHDIGF